MRIICVALYYRSSTMFPCTHARDELICVQNETNILNRLHDIVNITAVNRCANLYINHVAASHNAHNELICS